jgi:hypothetical protein
LFSGCGGREQPAPNFAPPDYSYLPKLRLNVGSVTINDHSGQSAGPNELGPTSPVPPDQALQQMARDRLVAAGNSGGAVFTIDQASITGTGGGELDGRMAVHLDILTGNDGHAGYAEAHVSRHFTPGTEGPDGGTRAELYALTQQMMQDMNVEFEYQVRRSLRDWLVDASGAPIGGSVEQQALPPPGATAPVTSAPAGATSVGATPLGATPLGPTPLAPGSPSSGTPSSGLPASSGPVTLAPQPSTPSAVFPEGSSAPAPAAQPRSPAPGFLQPPPSASPAPPAATNGY